MSEYYHDHHSETMFIGGLLGSPEGLEYLPEAMDILGLDNPFYNSHYAKIWDTACKMYLENNKVTSQEILKHVFIPEDLFRDIQDAWMGSIVSCAENIKICYLRRKMFTELEKIINAKDIDILDSMTKLQDFTSWLETKTTQADSERTMFDITNEELTRVENIRAGIPVEKLKTYYNPLDEIFGLLDYGFYMIAGAEKAGKSRFAASLMLRIEQAWRLNKIDYSQVYLMMEMRDINVTRMMCANIANIGTGKIKAGELSNDEYQRFIKASEYLSEARIKIIDKYSTIDVDELSLLVDFYIRKYNAKYFFIDHLLYLSIRGRFFSEREKWGAITSKLKTICKNKKVVMFVLCHLTKGTKDKPTAKDMLTFGTADKDCYGSFGLWNTGIRDIDGKHIMEIVGFHSRDGIGGEFEIKADLGKCQFSE